MEISNKTLNFDESSFICILDFITLNYFILKCADRLALFLSFSNRVFIFIYNLPVNAHASAPWAALSFYNTVWISLITNHKQNFKRLM
jgi:hypothetical protein